MINQKINISQIFQFIKPEWLFMTISLFNGILFVVFNSISIWLTASLINSVLTDFNQLVLDHKALLTEATPTLNQKLKIIVNNFILRETNIETLEILCFSIIVIFNEKYFFIF